MGLLFPNFWLWNRVEQFIFIFDPFCPPLVKKTLASSCRQSDLFSSGKSLLFFVFNNERWKPWQQKQRDDQFQPPGLQDRRSTPAKNDCAIAIAVAIVTVIVAQHHPHDHYCRHCHCHNNCCHHHNLLRPIQIFKIFWNCQIFSY